MQIQYKAPRNWLQTLLQTEIAQGMALTLRRMFNRPITRQYPEEKPVVAAGFRGGTPWYAMLQPARAVALPACAARGYAPRTAYAFAGAAPQITAAWWMPIISMPCAAFFAATARRSAR